MKQLSNLIEKLENELYDRNMSEEISLRISNNSDFDFQINNLVKFQSHNDIEQIKNSFYKIIQNDSSVRNFEISENYFINIEIDIPNFLHNFEEIEENIKVSNPNTIIFDYGGPNIGKPLHVGHLRSLNI